MTNLFGDAREVNRRSFLALAAASAGIRGQLSLPLAQAVDGLSSSSSGAGSTVAHLAGAEAANWLAGATDGQFTVKPEPGAVDPGDPSSQGHFLQARFNWFFDDGDSNDFMWIDDRRPDLPEQFAAELQRVARIYLDAAAKVMSLAGRQPQTGYVGRIMKHGVELDPWDREFFETMEEAESFGQSICWKGPLYVEIQPAPAMPIYGDLEGQWQRIQPAEGGDA